MRDIQRIELQIDWVNGVPVRELFIAALRLKGGLMKGVLLTVSTAGGEFRWESKKSYGK